MNKRMVEIFAAILESSKTEPIVILQADHGTASSFYDPESAGWEHPSEVMLKERLNIFSAFLVPSRARGKLYPTMTPVNNFRFVFRNVFSHDIDLLDDKSYYSTYDHSYRFVDVTAQLNW